MIYISNITIKKYIENIKEIDTEGNERVVRLSDDKIEEEVIVKRSVYSAEELDGYTELDNYVSRGIKDNLFVKAVVYDTRKSDNIKYTKYKDFYEWEKALSFNRLLDCIVDIHHKDILGNDIIVEYSVDEMYMEFPTEKKRARLYRFEITDKTIRQKALDFETDNCKQGLNRVRKWAEKAEVSLQDCEVRLNMFSITDYFTHPNEFELITQNTEEFDYSLFRAKIKGNLIKKDRVETIDEMEDDFIDEIIEKMT